MTPLLQARQLTYTIDGRTILQGIYVDVQLGEKIAVTGPSGSGKTSLLYILAGMVRPTGGAVTFKGQPLNRMLIPADGVATVLQGYGLVGLLTAAENIAIALNAAGMAPDQAAANSRQALTDLGLDGHEDQLADELSGGQQQRTAVARALALRPQLLIADEPTAELDPASRALVLQRLVETTGSGRSVILATHDPEVAAVCDRRIALGG